MKTSFKLLTVLVLFGTMTVGLAKEPSLILRNEKDNNSLIFRLDTPSRDTAIRLFDRHGNTIYSETTGDVAMYGKKFDLNKLGSGYYFFEIEDSFRQIVYTIEVAKDAMRILEKEEKLKPIFRKKGNKLYLNLLNLEESNVQIKVLDSRNRVLFTEVIRGELVVEKAINFEKAYLDNYTVVVQSGGETYYENVLVD